MGAQYSSSLSLLLLVLRVVYKGILEHILPSLHFARHENRLLESETSQRPRFPMA